MELKKLHMGTIVFGWDAMDEVTHMLSLGLEDEASSGKLRPPLFIRMRLINRSPAEELDSCRTGSRTKGHVDACD